MSPLNGPRFLILRRAAASILLLGLLSIVSARADTPVSGTYLVDKKPVQLKYARAIKGTPFDNKDTTVVVFTEKDASKSKSPDADTMFGKLGGGLIITVTSDGELVGTQIVSKGVQFSASGDVKLSDFKAEGGKLTGKLSTNGEATFFKDTWQIDLVFSVPAP